MKKTTQFLAGGSATLAIATALVLATAGAASAHVGVGGTSTAAGSSSVLTFSASHGCDGSPTTSFTISIPDELNAATPTANPNWTVEKVLEALETPVTDAHGNEVTERVSQIVYTAKEPLADGVRDTFQVSVTLPEDAAGQTLYFPTVQACVEGENAWVELPAEGQDPHDLEAPAPALVVTDAVAEEGHGHDAAAETEEVAVATAAEPVNALSIAALVAGVLGLVAGLAALVRSRKKA